MERNVKVSEQEAVGWIQLAQDKVDQWDPTS
jgi:hypothetical protein